MFIQQIFHLPLRQTEGYMNWLARIMKVDITTPNLRSMKIIKSCDAQVIIPLHKTTVVSNAGDTWQIKPWNRNENEYENSRYY